jgi:electron transport complex protein RnfG
MVLVMGMVGLIASVLLVGTYQLTAPYIARNRAAALERAIFDVIPDAQAKVTFAVTEDGGLEPTSDGTGTGTSDLIYAGYDSTGTLKGVAIEGSGQGFQDVLGLIFGYSPDCKCVTGMTVLETKETPGLGDKIEKDPAFLSNIASLDVSLKPDGSSLAHPVEVVKKGQREQPWQLEAISGATISSTAVGRIIDRYAGSMVPIVEANLEQLERGGR